MSTTPQPWTPSPRIAIDLDTGPGDRECPIPTSLIESSRLLLDATIADVGRIDGLAEMVDERTEGRFRKESEALGKLLGRDWQSVVVANVSYDLVLSSFACSTAAIATPSGPALFRNMDWWPEHLLARASCVVEYRREGRTVFEAAGWAAASGVVTGMSGRGFAVALNAVGGLEGTDIEGYPVLLHLRRVLEDAESYAHAVELLTDEHLASPALFIVVGGTPEERIVIERSPTRSATRSARGTQSLVATNEYRALGKSPTSDGGTLAQTSCGRFDALASLTDSAPRREHEEGDMLRALTHPEVMMGITAQHVIARPNAGDLKLFVPTRLVAGDVPGTDAPTSGTP